MQVLNHEYVRVCVEVAEVKGEGEWQVVYIVLYSIYCIHIVCMVHSTRDYAIGVLADSLCLGVEGTELVPTLLSMRVHLLSMHARLLSMRANLLSMCARLLSMHARLLSMRVHLLSMRAHLLSRSAFLLTTPHKT